MDNVFKKMLKYPDFDLEWENMYVLGKLNQDNNDDKKWQLESELDPLQHRSMTGLAISLTQVCWMMLPMKKVCKIERMILKLCQSLKLVCL